MKIGYVASKVERRVQTLQCGSPFELELIGVISGDLRLEKRIHFLIGSVFGHFRAEWFHATHAHEFLRLTQSEGIAAAFDLYERRIQARKVAIRAHVAETLPIVTDLGITHAGELVSALRERPALRQTLSPARAKFQAFECVNDTPLSRLKPLQ